MKMNKFIATYWRGNPQMKSGGYETTREIEAKTLASATKKAEKKCVNVSYGSMSLLSIVQA